jgi:septal ring factor EnvC (AmiA/AmiB activator)
LQSQRQRLQKQIKEQERKLQANRHNVKQRLENLQIINTEIADKRRTIDTIRQDIYVLDGNIATMDIQLQALQQKLDERKQNYMKSMRYMHRNRSLQNQLMFIFSAKNFSEMYRRLRFTREYAQYQRAQGEAVQMIQDQMLQAQDELTTAKRQKNDLLYRGEQERKTLETKQVEQQKVVSTLQREQKTIESLIAEQRKKDAALNAQIEKLIAEEVARAKARAEAEAKRQAEERRKAAEEAARKRAEELARKKAAAEAAARENARRIAEAKAREERARQQALAAARKSAEEKAAAERAAREAERERREAERRAAEQAEAHEREVAEARREAKRERESFTVSTEDRRLSGNFESNRGRLPMPITGAYRIVSGFGQNSVEGLRGVQLNNKGINIKGQAGAQARCVFDGEVCAVFNIGGVMGVMVRHGSYISVYSNLSSVSVRRGQKVATRQILGTVNAECILQFQLRRGSAPQNPARWLSR